MRRKTILVAMAVLSIVVSVLSSVFILCGCAFSAGKDLMNQVKAAEQPANPAEPDDAFRSSMMGFSWNLLHEACDSANNVLISPASVYFTLAMIQNAAGQDTRAALLDVMQADGLAGDRINQSCRDWMILLSNAGAGTRLALVNSIWYKKGFSPDQDFLQINADYFSAAARALDFKEPAAADVINRWISKNTQGKITRIVGPISPDVIMYLINAVYFKADWAAKFKPARTAEGDFMSPGGKIKARFMHQTRELKYLEGAKAQGVLIPYKDRRFAFLALLPGAGSSPRQLIADLAADSLVGLMKNSKVMNIDLKLPRFTVSYEDSLEDDLSVLGMKIAFDPEKADFSMMSADRSMNLYITDVKHKAFIRVDENGTEAAASTSIGMGLTGLKIDLELAFDRPFIYGIIDTATDLPLFLGVLNEPD